MLQGALLGSLVTLPVGILFVAPLVPGLWVKITFAVIWAGFGILHLRHVEEIAGHVGMTEFDERWDFRVGLVVGLLAGLSVVPVTGVGVDMLPYAALVLVFRTDLKIAIPTSVIAMAANSLMGLTVKAAATGFEPGLVGNWLAAAPVVALGAPLGVFVVSFIGRKPTLIVVSLLCLAQFFWTCHHEYALLGWGGILVAVLAVLALLVVFGRLRARGARLVGERRQGVPPPT